MKTKTQHNPWAALDALMKADPEPTGPEWFTVYDYTDRYGGSTSGNAAKLKRDTRFKQWTGISGESRRRTTKYCLK